MNIYNAIVAGAKQLRCFIAAGAIGLLLTSGSAAADPFGMIANGSITEPCSAFSSGSGGFSCGPFSTTPDSDEAFGTGVTSVSISVQNPGEPGTFGSASGDIDTASGLPELFAYAQSVAGDGTFVSVEAINLFTYTGPDNFLLEITGLYSGTTSGVGATMFGSIALIAASDLSAAALQRDLDFGSSPSFCFGECYTPLDQDGFNTTDGGLEFFTLAASTVVNNGDQFYVWTSFGGRAVGDSVFDGLSTASFLLNTTDVIAATVPLPASLWLLLSSTGALAWAQRRRVRRVRL